ncbi:MAG: hypothetical protein RLZZ271_819 [Pseudomonadota bacterium]|jgi:two-component system sensor histidine kinase PilS (NtrC family)
MNQQRLSAATTRMGQVLDVMPESASAGRPVRRAPLFVRLWMGFLTGRLMVAFVLLVLPVLLSYFGVPMYKGQLIVALIYFAMALAQRALASRSSAAPLSERVLAFSVLVDVICIGILNDLTVRTVNYYALLALPLMYTSILGSRRLAMGAAAGISLLLISDAVRLSTGMDAESSRRLTQAGLTGAGAWGAVLLVHYLSERLELEADLALAGQEAVRQQIQINEVVIEAMSMGVVVVNSNLETLTFNPAAAHMLGLGPGVATYSVSMGAEPEWQPVCRVIEKTFSEGRVHREVVELQTGQGRHRSLQVTTRLTTTAEAPSPQRRKGGDFCVIFLEDTHALQERVRTEKLAAMGRMSAAVAHEIRNPLAAISQANQLLAEDLGLAAHSHQRLISIIAQNAHRLGQTVEDILEVSRGPGAQAVPQVMELQQVVAKTCEDWGRLYPGVSLDTALPEEVLVVNFDPEHLRRILVNLLDNAHRHARGVPMPDIRVFVSSPFALDAADSVEARLCVWNAGQAIDASVVEHLFEPFFSSNSRSSGLGLFICRELCDLHAARIEFDRVAMLRAHGAEDEILGNQFTVSMQLVARRPKPTDET